MALKVPCCLGYEDVVQDHASAGFYHQFALDSKHKNDWVIHLQGGGECATADLCAKRLNQSLGSSKYFPTACNFSATPESETPKLYDIGGIFIGQNPEEDNDEDDQESTYFSSQAVFVVDQIRALRDQADTLFSLRFLAIWRQQSRINMPQSARKERSRVLGGVSARILAKRGGQDAGSKLKGRDSEHTWRLRSDGARGRTSRGGPWRAQRSRAQARRGRQQDPPPWFEASWSKYGWWLLSDDAQRNPDLWGWNHVLVPYCSQDLHSGQVVGTTHVEGLGGVHYAGHLIVQAVLAALDERGLVHADQIVLSGHSAGGMGVWLHLDWLARRYPAARVVGAPIAGFYFFAYPYQGPGHTDPAAGLADFREPAWASYWALWQAFADESCLATLNTQPWRCMLANESHPFVTTPVFITQAQTDQVVLVSHDWFPPADWTPPALDYLREWHGNMSAALGSVTQRCDWDGAACLDVGFFSPACFTHVNFTQAYPLVGGLSFVEVFGNWLHPARKGPTRVQDECGELCNPTC
mmetsp:Transcript_13111/g.36227  ORF Transcript_13111/g.36227 Transcript_13111/m.36227 type:complete len:525 (+) Transcript_13111:2-1576(+)